MKTIRGKITVFFILCLLFIGILTGLYYKNTVDLRKKLITIENFDDVLNNILELRRYEKNFIYYHDLSSLKECTFYFSKIDKLCKKFKGDICRVGGKDAYISFSKNLMDYKNILEYNIKTLKNGGTDFKLTEIRKKGKALVDFAQRLIQIKRHRIDEALGKSLIIPLLSMSFFLVFVLLIFQFVNHGILRPLSLLEKATEEVAKDTFKPITYPGNGEDEISRLIAGFNRMAQELESRQEQLLQSRKLASIGTFISGIAHELNNPLNNISLTAETLQIVCSEMNNPEINELLQDILSQAERASQVVKNLLEFSRREKPNLRNLSVPELIDNTLNLVKNQVMITGIEVVKNVPVGLPLIKGKKQNLEQAFLNIITNAIQAMPDGGCLTIQAQRDTRGYVRIDITDTGVGIDPSNMEHIFDPFFTTKEAGSGTGLGLSLVYRIIRNHGGYIEVKSKLNKGTTFSIYLPIARDEQQDVK